MRNNTIWKIIAVIELVSAALVIIFDLFVPTLVVFGLIVVSLLARRNGFSSLGFKKDTHGKRMAASVFGLMAVWSIINLGLILPVLNHLTGFERDVSAFSHLQGNLTALMMMLAISWIMAALGEELVYRGYLQTRVQELFGNTRLGVWVAVLSSSILFGLAHTEQGTVGVLVTFIDGLMFSAMKRYYDNNLWASVLAHGFLNMIGIISYYFFGPIPAFW